MNYISRELINSDSYAWIHFQNVTENQEAAIFESYTDLARKFKNKENEKNINLFLLKIKIKESDVQRSMIGYLFVISVLANAWYVPFIPSIETR